MAHSRTEALAGPTRNAAQQYDNVYSVVHHVGFPSDAAVLAVGSRSQGLATDNSDIDVMVLLQGHERISPPSKLSVRREKSRLASRFLLQPEGKRLDVEAVRARAVRPLAHAMEEIGNCLESWKGEEPLPDLQADEMRLLTRIRDGHVIKGADRIETWRKWLRVDLVPAYFCAVHFIAAMSHLEDAFGLAQAKRTLGSAVATRAAAESMILSALAYEGLPCLALKFAPDYVQRLAAERSLIPPVLGELQSLLFPVLRNATDDYRLAVYRCALDLHQHFVSEGNMPSAVRLLGAYGKGRWQLDLSFLGTSGEGTQVTRPL